MSRIGNKTERELMFWRSGQLGSERLAAQILLADGYLDVNPIHPHGGPDGGKDIICKKNDMEYRVAVYFSGYPVDFTNVQSKFLGDLVKIAKSNAEVMIFFTNNRISEGERHVLLKEAKSKDLDLIIYHIETIRSRLDNPICYGIREEYLGIPMSLSELISYIESHNQVKTREEVIQILQEQQAIYHQIARQELSSPNTLAVINALMQDAPEGGGILNPPDSDISEPENGLEFGGDDS